MNAVLGITYLALKTDLTAKQRDYLTKTKVAGQDLAHEIYNRVFRNVPERLVNK
jgi:hypothetical protein